MKTSVTMKDIAKALGVSQTTVSFTLSGKANLFGISAETQERILKHVESIGTMIDLVLSDLFTGREKKTRYVLTGKVILRELVGVAPH